MGTINFRSLLTLLYHVLSWVLIFSLVGFMRKPENMHQLSVPQMLICFTPFIALFYVNGYVFVPGYFKQRQLGRYLLSIAGCLVLATLLSSLLLYYFRPLTQHEFRINAIRIIPGFFCLAASFGIGSVRENNRLEKQRKERETENLRTELSFLRSQVNPHFMLNVINSIVAAARVKPDKVEPALIELAGLMSYMLYNNSEEKVLLGDEIEYLESYIKLQMLRFGDDVQLDFRVERNDSNPSIEPMLLIPLVENAFKHGIGLVDQPVIQVHLQVSADNEVSLLVKNKYNELALATEDKHSGIGLTNLKKRLQLIYPGKFTLLTSQTGDFFTSTLNLQLS
ncbi:MAG TPA: histidine kinase [Chitinophagaceae bacterium]|jgi:LytS/YehU family sensor histidine kinase